MLESTPYQAWPWDQRRSSIVSSSNEPSNQSLWIFNRKKIISHELTSPPTLGPSVPSLFGTYTPVYTVAPGHLIKESGLWDLLRTLSHLLGQVSCIWFCSALLTPLCVVDLSQTWEEKDLPTMMGWLVLTDNLTELRTTWEVSKAHLGCVCEGISRVD
jgi:hypothetical protein